MTNHRWPCRQRRSDGRWDMEMAWAMSDRGLLPVDVPTEECSDYDGPSTEEILVRLREEERKERDRQALARRQRARAYRPWPEITQPLTPGMTFLSGHYGDTPFCGEIEWQGLTGVLVVRCFGKVAHYRDLAEVRMLPKILSLMLPVMIRGM